MKTRSVINFILLLLGALAMTGCAAAATTANVVRVDAAPAVAVVATIAPAPEGLAAQGAAAPVANRSGGGPAEGQVVEITPPPDAVSAQGGPAALADEPLESPAPLADELSPTATPAPTKTPEATPEPTKEPEPTPAYTVEELDEYVDGYVNAKTVNLRKGPGTGYDVLAEYERYDTLLITGKCEEWYRVKLDGLRGYMLKEYVSVGEPEEPTPEPTPKATEKPKATPTPEPVKTPAPTEAPAPTPAPTDPPAPNLSGSDELYLVAQVVYKEGDRESYVAVANVIYNRLQSGDFPNSIHDVIYQKSQFSTSNLKTPSSSALAAVQQIFVEGNLVLPAEVMYFHAASRGTERSGYTYYGSFGGNAFFYK